MIVIGVDGHKVEHTLVAADGLGRRLAEYALVNAPTTYAGALQWAQQVGDERLWAIENSGRFTRAFAQYLLGQGERVVEVSPRWTARTRQGSRDYAKSDPHDALAIARVALREDTPLPSLQLEDETTELKLWVEQRDNLVKERVRLLNQLHAQLSEVEPTYKERLGLLTQPKTLRTCRRYRRGSGRHDQIRAQIIRQLAGLVLTLNEPIAQLEQQIRPLVDQIAPVLLSVTGIGWLHAAHLISYVGPIQLVKCAAALAHYAATAPIRYGTAGRYYHRLDHRGHRRLNCVFHRIAQVQARFNPLAKAYLEKKKAEGKTPKQAFRCLKRRMVDIVYAVWKSGRTYQPPELQSRAA